MKRRELIKPFFKFTKLKKTLVSMVYTKHMSALDGLDITSVCVACIDIGVRKLVE